MNFSFNIPKQFVYNLLLLFFLFSNTLANAQTLEWAKSMGGSGGGVTGGAQLREGGHTIAVDAAGNVYTSGIFEGTADFNPGAGVFNLTSAGENDIFISKLDAGGNFIWAKRIGGTGFDHSGCIAVDATSNVYLVGSFRNTVDFDPGAGVTNLTSAGQDDIFILKLDAAGDFIWVKQIGGTFIDIAHSIALDETGNIHVTGYFRNTVDFDPGPDVFNLLGLGGWDDVFVLKLDATGNFIWAKEMGGSSFDIGYSITVDAAGNVYTTGSFRPDFITNIVDFDPGSGVFNLITAAANVSEVFVSKLDVSGNFVWAKAFTGLGFDWGNAIAVDAAGNVFTVGEFWGETDFDPGPGVYNLTGPGGGSKNWFLSKLDAAGNLVFVEAFGEISATGSVSADAKGIVLDNSDNIYIAGTQSQPPGTTIDYDPGPDVFNLTGAGNDVGSVILKYDNNGNLLCGFSIEGGINGTGTESVFSTLPRATDRNMAIDGADNIYLTGALEQTASSADFDPCTNTVNVTDYGLWDAYVAKYTNPTDFIWTNDTVCPSDSTYFTANYTSSCSPPDSLVWDFDDPGSGLANTSNLQNPAHVFSSAGTYNVNLTVYWPCGKGTISYPVTIIMPVLTGNINTSICLGDSILLGGSYQKIAGVYKDTILGGSISGCDSIVNTNLVVNPSPMLGVTPQDTSIKKGESVIISLSGSASIVGYQWNPLTYLNTGLDTIETISPDDDIMYTITAIDTNGCKNSVTSNIKVNEPLFLFVPNAISTNEDGNNDGFKIQGEGFKLISLVIYNRWGNKVFEGDASNDVWIPKKGSSGVYVYQYQLERNDDGVLTEGKGNITLIR